MLIAEACSHHPLQDDIGRIKIPRWLRQYVGGELDIDVSAGRDYPENIQQYRLIIHCGGCMLTRREMLDKGEIAASGTHDELLARPGGVYARLYSLQIFDGRGQAPAASQETPVS